MKKIIKKQIASAFLLVVVMFAAFSFTEPAEWQIFENKPLGFSIKFPGKPVETTKTEADGTDSVLVNLVQLNVSADTSNSNLLYLASHTLINETVTTKEAKDTMFAHTIKGIIGSTKGIVVSKTDITIKGVLAEDVKINMQGKVIFTLRAFLIGKHYYSLGVITRPWKQDNNNIKKFLDSFKSE